MNKNNWIPIEKRTPTEEKEYLCQEKYYQNKKIMRVYKWVDDLYKMDKYDFSEYRGKRIGGFVYYCSLELRYVKANIEAWQELPEEYVKEEK